MLKNTKCKINITITDTITAKNMERIILLPNFHSTSFTKFKIKTVKNNTGNKMYGKMAIRSAQLNSPLK